MSKKTMMHAAAIIFVTVFVAQTARAQDNLPPPPGYFYDLNNTQIPGGGSGVVYQQYTVNFTASLTSTDITFAFREDPAFISFTDVSLVDLTHNIGNQLLNGDFTGGVYCDNGNCSTPVHWSYANIFGASFGGIVTSCSPAPSGNTSCWLDGAVQAYDAIDQVVSTNIGDTYQISFYVADDSDCSTDGGPPCNFMRTSNNGQPGTGGNGINVAVYALAGLPFIPSITSVTSSPNPSMFGDVVTITATVSPSGPPAPTGTANFTSNGTAISGCTAVGLSSGMAVCNTTSLAVGTDALVATYSGDNNYAGSSGMLSQIVNPVPRAVQFVPATPCRVVDTRLADGTFGGPAIAGNTSRAFPLSEGDNLCSIPPEALAYSLNVTVVPTGPLNYLTIWPTDQGQPLVSTLNSSDGRVKANAAIVPAGTPSGSVSVYVTDTTNVILDINGYFIPNSDSTLAFYPLVPCRVVDTRDPNKPEHLGPPTMGNMEVRDLPILTSPCLQGVTNPQAYSFNVTVVDNPLGQPLNYLTVWPSDQQQPYVSTLNNPTATVVANGAIVPAAQGTGNIKVFAYNSTDVIMDINGYFAAPGGGGYSFYAVTPCRVYDSRNNNGQPFQGERTVDVVDSQCGPPSSAQAYVLNATVVPSGFLDFLTLWPDGENQPVVSTLNAYDGFITSNLAIVPNLNGSLDAYASQLTQLILDISGYFAP